MVRQPDLQRPPRYGYYTMLLLDGPDVLGRADLRREGSRIDVLSKYEEQGVSKARFEGALSQAASELGAAIAKLRS